MFGMNPYGGLNQAYWMMNPAVMAPARHWIGAGSATVQIRQRSRRRRNGGAPSEAGWVATAAGTTPAPRGRRAQSRSRLAAHTPEAPEPGFDAEHCSELTRMLSAGSESQAEALAALRGSVWRAARDAGGCRVVQHAIEIAKRKDQADLAAELQGHVIEAVHSPHANFVIQKVIEILPTELARFVVEECTGSGVVVAKHRYGCRILCRLLEHSSNDAKTIALIDEVLHDAGDLCCHSFGHHVVQSIMEHGTYVQRRQIADALHRDLLKMAQNRHASYIVEGAFRHCSEEDRQALVSALVNSPQNIVSLAQNQFGSFVVKVLLQQPGDTPQVVLEHLRSNADQLQQGKYGKKLLDDLDVKIPANGAKLLAQGNAEGQEQAVTAGESGEVNDVTIKEPASQQPG